MKPWGAIRAPLLFHQNEHHRNLSRISSSWFKPFKFNSQPYEYKVVPLRECPTPETMQLLRHPGESRRVLALARSEQTHYFNPNANALRIAP